MTTASRLALCLALVVTLGRGAAASTAEVTYEPPVDGAPEAVELAPFGVVHSGGSTALVRLPNGRALKLATGSSALLRELAGGDSVEVRVTAGLVLVERAEGGVSSAGRNSTFVLERAKHRGAERFEPTPAEGDEELRGRR